MKSTQTLALKLLSERREGVDGVNSTTNAAIGRPEL